MKRLIREVARVLALTAEHPIRIEDLMKLHIVKYDQEKHRFDF